MFLHFVTAVGVRVGVKQDLHGFLSICSRSIAHPVDRPREIQSVPEPVSGVGALTNGLILNRMHEHLFFWVEVPGSAGGSERKWHPATRERCLDFLASE
jgi:hypothetical protein